MTETNDVIRLTIPAKPEFVSIARLASSGAASRMGYSFDAIEDIKVAVSEACTNAVSHGYKQMGNGQIGIVMECGSGAMTITVTHNGESFDASRVLQELKPLDPSTDLDEVSEGGLGLFLINALMDHVTISTEYGVAVRMIKFLNRDGVGHIVDKVSTTE
ncbi:anti-sigma B factor RsbW [Sporolactobacillus laevolacticus]|uniref:anti-sigma B factor RsbW n=1 Tax=Sporolactobacillus laevolacticus TaxID=33018 RepID=UPI0025B36AE2|nr:anti-sigma B factor RsbW [Sporolactobacillus laevolacticus]MDN3956963.1 anti-sigma B factor RsbW [Sporolactobacillus laevolacticus]